jgi:hypothetical protein
MRRNQILLQVAAILLHVLLHLERKAEFTKRGPNIWLRGLNCGGGHMPYFLGYIDMVI